MSVQKPIGLFYQTISNGSLEGFQKVRTSSRVKNFFLLMISLGYKVGFVSPIYEYNSSSPTIVELLTYWIAASARVVGTYHLPKVCLFTECWDNILTTSMVLEGARACYLPYS